MAHYIDKSALLAEINKRIMDAPINYIGHQRVWAYNDVKDILNNLEVKEIGIDLGSPKGHQSAECTIDTKALEVEEVDFTKEVENLIEKEKAFVTENREVKFYNGDSFNHIYELEYIAKHFFELGLKAQKGEKV